MLGSTVSTNTNMAPARSNQLVSSTAASRLSSESIPFSAANCLRRATIKPKPKIKSSAM